MIHQLYFERINADLKRIFAISLLLLFSGSLLAQDQVARDGTKLHFGLEMTPSIIWLKAKDPLPPALDGDGSKLGFAFGLMTEFSISRNYSFATGIDISYRGGNLKRQITSGTGIPNDSLTQIISSNYTMEYIEIPLTLKMKTNEIGYFTYFGQFGLAPGINISSKGDIHIQSQTDSLGRTGAVTTTDANGADIKSVINSFNLSLIVSVGVEYSLGGSTTALAAITFNNGFLNVLSSTNANGAPEKAISNCLGLKVGVLF